MASRENIVFEDVCKFYGEVLGVNRVDLEIGPGITGLVGPNGSGKTTLMNLMTGLLQPTRGRIEVQGISPREPDRLFTRLGYCSQFDSFPRGMTGYQLIYSFLRVHGYLHKEADAMTWAALDKVSLQEAAKRKVAAYSKGMRQRIRLGQSIAHDPDVLVLDEPLNGLDPMARAEVIDLFRRLAEEGKFLIVSSHILHELDVISDRVIMLNNGYVVAEGEIQGVREEVKDVPSQIMMRCDMPSLLAARIFQDDHATEVKMHDDGMGLHLRTRDTERFYLLVNQIVTQEGMAIESVQPTDDDVDSVYQYLIGGDGGMK